MKLKELTIKVINYLKKTKKPKSAIEIAKGIKLPLEKKRRIYDIMDVLSAANYVKITRKGNEKFIRLNQINNEKREISETKENTIDLREKQYCILNLDLVFSASDFKTLKNDTWQAMILRDVKRQIKEIVDIRINEVKLVKPDNIIV
ncbi:MAG: hypothetical protein ACTSQY_09185 [Candidatus Odinarchaeia archaeon]